MIIIYYKKEIGNEGEDFASDYLENNNYTVIARNFTSKSGEIDIIALDYNVRPVEYVFIEVKTRKHFEFGKPAESVTKYKIKHIYKTAQYFLYKYKIKNVFCRFDVIEVYEMPNCNYKLKHIKKAIIDNVF